MLPSQLICKLLIKIDPERESGEGDMRFDCAGRGFAKVLASLSHPSLIRRSSVAHRLAEGAEPVKHSLIAVIFNTISERCLGAADSIAPRIPPGRVAFDEYCVNLLFY